MRTNQSSLLLRKRVVSARIRELSPLVTSLEAELATLGFQEEEIDRQLIADPEVKHASG